MISIDDYNPKNIELAKLIKKYGLEKDTWFAIQLNTIDSHDQIEELHRMGFNIASHTVTHAFLSEVPQDRVYWELKESKRVIDKITGKNTDWLVYPRGRYKQTIFKTLKKLGYKYARTTLLKDRESPYERGGCHLTYPRKEYQGIDPFEWAKKSKLDHYWGHYFELDKFMLMEKFEEFLNWYKKDRFILKGK